MSKDGCLKHEWLYACEVERVPEWVHKTMIPDESGFAVSAAYRPERGSKYVCAYCGEVKEVY